ncbi:MAG TPA: sulfatase-like hydrolase/transferase [Sphingomicrobium sp.]|nr:sulfatase-like hydrolase/transferase [Sphingomicrobium sp.]
MRLVDVIVALIAILAAGLSALWLLFPVQLMVLIVRLRRPVGPARPVTWESGPATPPAGERPPNIILIVADDLGFNDLSLGGAGCGVAGGLVQTPNIDAIAHQGVQFTQGYAAHATCSPSRAALLTGRYPARFGFEFTAVPSQLAKYVPRNSPKGRPYPTIYHADRQGQVPPMEAMGLPGGEVTIAELLKPRGYHTVHLGKWHVGEAPGMRPEEQGFDESLGFLSGAIKYRSGRCVEARIAGDPLDRLLWLALNDAVQYNGGPRFHAGEYMTDYLSNEAVAAIEANRNRPFFLYLAYSAPHTPFQATQADYDALPAIADHRTRVYGAMVSALDRGIGRVMDALKAQGIDDDTIVIFTNDNGGAWYAGLPDINKPYRGWKGTFFEGGIRVPFFIRWPSKIAAGQRLSMPAQHVDVFATAAAAAGADMPSDRQMDGLNLLAYAMGKVAPPAGRTLFWRSGDYKAIRDGDWKLQVSNNPARTWLFDLATDPTEQTDLSSQQPDQVKRLHAKLIAHDREMPEPLWPALLEEPIRIDFPAGAPWSAGQEFVYWPN